MDLGRWLRSLGLDKYEADFRKNGIDDQVLRHITAEDLREIGVATVGDRRKLLAAIAELAAPSPPTEARWPSLATSSRSSSEASAERRPVTIMFCDLVGSTALAGKLDAEDWRNLVNAYLDEASKAVSNLGGHVLKRLGDGLMALFGYPQAQENDAERAVRAGLAIQRALADINVTNSAKGGTELSARIGLEFGPVVVEAAGEVFGDAPNVAARVQAAADPGSVLITANVQRQVAGLFVAEDKGAHALKGVSAPVALFRIVRASGGRRFGARALTPLIGRDEELDLLRRRWERARAGEGQFALIVGEPGIGKSRLVEEFRLGLGQAPHTFVEWSSSQLLQNTPLHALAEWGRQRFGADESAARRLADLDNTLRLVGLDPAEYTPLLAPLVDIPLPEERAAELPPEELRRRQLEASTAWVLAGARSQPIALAFGDLHWADPTSLDLLQTLAERGRQAPLFIIATARPEFRPPWRLRSHHSVISLSPLDRADVARMVGDIAQRHALSQEMVEGLSERTGGVPLFVEEVTRLLLERGEAGGAHSIPPTLQQSLAARLDRLGEAREVAQIGAVLGRSFSYGLLRAVAAVDSPPTDGRSSARPLDRGPPPPPRSRAVPLPRFSGEDTPSGAAFFLPRSTGEGDHAEHGGGGVGGGGNSSSTDGHPSGRSLDLALQSALDRLAGADLLIADGAGHEATYRFKHALIQDAAYDSLLKGRRQALHRRAAEVLRDSVERAAAEPEVIAHHFTQAGLDGEAVEWWGRAGDQALRRSAFQEAIAHLGKAISVADKAGGKAAGASAERRHLHAAYGNALIAARGFGAPETTEAFARAREFALGDEGASERLAGDYGLWAGSYVRGELAAMRERATALLGKVAAGPDSPEAGVAHRAVGITHWYAGEPRQARAHLEQALALFQPSRDDDLAFRFGLDAGVATTANLAHALWPLGEVERAAALIDATVARSASLAHAATFAFARQQAATFELMRGDRARAAPHISELARIVRDHDLPMFRAFSLFLDGWANGDLADMRRGAALLREQNVMLSDGALKMELADAEARAGDVDRALTILDEALATGERAGFHAYEAELNRVRGEMLLRRDSADAGPAEEAFRVAIAIARRQGTLSFELRAALALGRLYQATGRPADARAVLAPALEGFSPTTEMPEIEEAQALLAALMQ